MRQRPNGGRGGFAATAGCRVIHFVITLVVLAAAVSASVRAQDSVQRAVRHSTTYEDLQLFSQVLNELRANHADSLDNHVLVMAAIEGMVRAADPHSFLIPAVHLSASKLAAFRAGQLVPAPISFVQVRGAFVVGESGNSAATQAGILAGDRLIAVDGVPVVASSTEELELMLAGAPHSDVALSFERRRLDGSVVTVNRTLTRQVPGVETAVPTAIMLDRRTGYLRISSFLSPKTADDVHAALGTLHDQGLQRLVLDLRDNGGGVIEEAARVAGEFLPTGSVIYTSDGRKHDAIDTGRVKRSFFRHEARYPVVVMINGGTASASELLAGALQDHDRAVIVGRPSFGKALMMRGVQLSDGSILMLVVGHTRTPCGRIIQRSYRGMAVRDYYEQALADRDTTGHPSCRTDGGRVVYGGGGIWPDVMLPAEPPVPAWLDRLRTDALPLQWIGGYVDAHRASYDSLATFAGAPVLPDSAVASFRAFAAGRGDSIPEGPIADRVVQRVLALELGGARWGPAGYYRVASVLDPEITAAVAAFDRSLAAGRSP
jgi:carboxyl-terminal processing protease